MSTDVIKQNIDLIRPCHPTEVALKSYFLGPQSENAQWLLSCVQETLSSWFDWRRNSFHQDGSAIGGSDLENREFKARQEKMKKLLAELTVRFEKELPKFSPRYVGHMFSETSLPALLGHILTLLHNPNIIAREAATVGADLENEAVEALARMIGLQRASGHFTSGGTVANYESVVRASARQHAWMAVGAALRARGDSDHSAWQSAHMGWKRYEALRAALSDEELRPFLPEYAGPWRAGQALRQAFQEEFSEPLLIVPHSAHYSWKKAARVLGVGEHQLRYIGCDLEGRYRVEQLHELLQQAQQDKVPVLAVVSVAGTTETGAIDPVDEIESELSQWRERGVHIWHHVDAAYGGFFCSMLRASEGVDATPSLEARYLGALAAIPKADSVTLDPHKLGYVPYSSGAFLAKDLRDYTCVRIHAPYLDYQDEQESNQMDRGPYTLEGSRSAAGAVATWLTARSIGLDQAGYGLILSRTVRQRQKVEAEMRDKLSSAYIFPGCDTNLLCFAIADPYERLSLTNARTLKVLDRLAGESRYYLTKTAFPVDGPHSEVGRAFVAQWKAQIDVSEVLVLRICLMNPFFDSSELDVEHVRHLIFSLAEVAD